MRKDRMVERKEGEQEQQKNDVVVDVVLNLSVPDIKSEKHWKSIEIWVRAHAMCVNL